MLLILEALISGSNNIPDLEKQIQYIQQLIAPLTTFLDTPDLLNHSSQFSTFLQLLEVGATWLLRALVCWDNFVLNARFDVLKITFFSVSLTFVTKTQSPARSLLRTYQQ